MVDEGRGRGVCLFPVAFPPDAGGVERVAAAIARHLAARGHDVRVIALAGPATRPESTEIEGTPVLRLPYPRYVRSWTRPIASLVSAREMSDMVSRARRFAPEPGVVHLHYIDVNAVIGLRLAREVGASVVATLHGSDVLVAGDANPFRRGLLARIAREAAAVTAVTPVVADEFRRITGSPREVRVIPNGVDPEIPEGEPPVGPFILFVGRIEAVKGLDVLLHAWARAGAEVAGLRFVVVGEGSLRGEMEALARRLGIAERVEFTGVLSAGRVAMLLGACRAVVLPSRSEGMPLLALEAMREGAPIIAARVGGLPALVQDGKTGLLVPPEDVGALASALARAASEPDPFVRMGRAGNEAGRAYRWDNVVPMYEDLYRGRAIGAAKT